MSFKNSFDILEEIESDNDNEYNILTVSKPYWFTFPIGKEWYDVEHGWIKKIEDEKFIKLDKRTIDSAVPLFCPKCKQPLNSSLHINSYAAKGHCLNCEFMENLKN